jgi:5-methylcytosine-specific restriction endonuclease McrA
MLQKRRFIVSNVLDTKVLVLNKLYSPIRTTTVRDAFSKIFSEIAEVITVEDNGAYVNYDFNSWAEMSEYRQVFDETEGFDWVSTPSMELMVPRVIRMLGYDKAPKYIARLTRKNIYDRDEHRCQYCGKWFQADELNIDHVIPRSRGGKNTWGNLVCSCIKCNRKKDNRTPKEAGMKLLKKPIKPSPKFEFRIHPSAERYEDWDHFVSYQYWNTTLKE